MFSNKYFCKKYFQQVIVIIRNPNTYGAGVAVR